MKLRNYVAALVTLAFTIPVSAEGVWTYESPSYTVPSYNYETYQVPTYNYQVPSYSYEVPTYQYQVPSYSTTVVPTYQVPSYSIYQYQPRTLNDMYSTYEQFGVDIKNPSTPSSADWYNEWQADFQAQQALERQLAIEESRNAREAGKESERAYLANCATYSTACKNQLNSLGD